MTLQFYFICLMLLTGYELVLTCPIGFMDVGGEYCYHVSEERMNWGMSQEVKSADFHRNIYILLFYSIAALPLI